ncbi:MAG: hypothetical protein ACTSRR_09740 [Candidatus Heimdallarchaeaceae archaeon]
MKERSKDRRDFLIAICLVAHTQMGKSLYIGSRIRDHIKCFEEAGLIDHVPVADCVEKERIKQFIEEYGGE